MKQLALLSLLAVSVFAAAPTFTLNPIVYNTTEDSTSIRFRVSDEGPSSTIAGSISGSRTAGQSVTFSVAAGNGSKFPTGSIINIGGHEHLLVTNRSTDSITAKSGYDEAPFLHVFTEFNTSITCSSNICVGTTTNPHYLTVGDGIKVDRSTLMDASVRTISSATSTTFTFTATATNGTDANDGLTVTRTPVAHSNGDTIQRIDNYAQVCFGATTSYGSIALAARSVGGTAYVQGTSMYINIGGQAPGSTIHYKVQVTSRANSQPDCDMPDGDVLETEDDTITFAEETEESYTPVLPTEVTWNYKNPSFTNTFTVASDCSDRQTIIDSTLALNGNNNYRIVIEEGTTCTGTVHLGPKTGSNPNGSGIIYYDSDVSIPEGLIDAETSLPVTRVATSAAAIFIDPAAHHWVIHGHHVTADPTKSSVNSMTSDFMIATSMDGSSHDYIDADRPHHIAFWQNIIDCPVWIVTCGGIRMHGEDLVFEDNIVGPLYRINDAGAIQIAGTNSARIKIKNNDIQGSFSGVFFEDGARITDIEVLQNWIHKPDKWYAKSIDYLRNAVQPAASVTAGNPTTISTGSSENNVINGKVMSFSGMTGSYAALNATIWSLTAGTISSVVCASNICTIVTSTAHGLTSGQYVGLGGGFRSPCHAFYTGDNSASQVTVTNSTTFTVVSFVNDFSTVSGSSYCGSSDLKVMGPVWPATKVNASSFTVAFDSTGFGNLTDTGTIYYPQQMQIKNAYEHKVGKRILIKGNVIEGSPLYGQNGQLAVFTVRNVSAFNGWPAATSGGSWVSDTVISDLTFRDNVLRNGCSGFTVLGQDDAGQTSTMRRVHFYNNLLLDISAFNQGPGGCLQTPFLFSGPYSYFDIKNNTIVGAPNRTFYEDSAGHKSGVINIENNILDKTADPANGSAIGFGLGSGNGSSSYSWLTATWERNVFYHDSPINNAGFYQQFYAGSTYGSMMQYQDNYWPLHHGGVGFVGAKAVTDTTNAAPIVAEIEGHGCETGDHIRILGIGGNTQANDFWTVRKVDDDHVVLVGSIGNGTHSGTGSMMPLKGCGSRTYSNFGLSMASVYKAGHSFTAPESDFSTPGEGPGSDGNDVGINATTLQAAIDGEEPEPEPSVSPISGSASVSGAASIQ